MAWNIFNIACRQANRRLMDLSREGIMTEGRGSELYRW